MSLDASRNELVRLLAALRREGRQQSGLEPRLVPKDSEAAYSVAGAVASELGWPVGGWKIAANKPEMQRALRTTTPIYGRVFAQFIAPSPCALRRAELLHPIVEAEYVARIGTPLPPRAEAYGEEEVAAAVRSLHPGIEVAQCRFVHDAAFPPLPAILADGSGSGAVVYGPAIESWRSADIAAQEVVLRVDGRERRRGTAGAALEHPLAAMTWLANALSRAGIGIAAGAFVSTGTLTGMLAAQAGEEHVADFGALGTVSVRFA
jgi:2-keto-4-pentenoate hydratase